MTNEELIKRLKTTEQMLNVAHFKEAESLIREACDAIEALEEPTGIETMWHKYPEEKPPKEDVPYLITCEYLWGEDRFVREAFWGDVGGVTLWFEIDSRGNDTPLTLRVFAWAEMPEPYKENKNDMP